MHYEELTNDCCEEGSANVERISLAGCTRLVYCFFSIAFLIVFSCATIGKNGIVCLVLSFSPSCVYLYLFGRQIKRRIKIAHAVEMMLYGALLSVFLAGNLEYSFSLFFFHFCYICFVKDVGGTLLFVCSVVVFFYFFLVVAYVEEVSKILPMIFVQMNEKKNKNEYVELPLVDSTGFLNEGAHEADQDEKKDTGVDKFRYIYANDTLEYIFFSLCSSAGFSSTENLLYAAQATRQNFLSIIVLRNLICVLFHMSCSGVASYNIATRVKQKSCAANLLGVLGCLFTSSLFHALYDYSIFFSSFSIPAYQASFLTLLFVYCFFCMLLIFSVLVRRSAKGRGGGHSCG
ncbi:protease, putative [Plasmodium vivax]|nr:protease, putative [Plasmodium vivax]